MRVIRRCVLALAVAGASPALACSVTPGPPLSAAAKERYARQVHAGPGDLVEVRMTVRATEARPGRAVVLRSLKGRFRPGQVVTITTDNCFGHGAAPAGQVFRTYAVRSPVSYTPLDRERQTLLVKLRLMPANWGIRGR